MTYYDEQSYFMDLDICVQSQINIFEDIESLKMF